MNARTNPPDDSGPAFGPTGPQRVGDLIAYAFRDRLMQPYVEAIREATEWRERQRAIRAYYQAYRQIHGPDEPLDPYESGISATWTPIEWRLWQDIRGRNRLPMVSQYPVGPYFLDFGDPVAKIAIEADGKGFHDPIRDARRDGELWDRHGWKVYRTTGAECTRVLDSPAEFMRGMRERTEIRPTHEQIRDCAEAFYLTTSSGIVDAIAHWEYGRWPGSEFSQLMHDALHHHRYAQFRIG